MTSIVTAQTQVNVKDFGAKGDGKSNDITAIRSAIAKVNRSGGTVYFPKGTYLTSIVDIQPATSAMISFVGEDGAVLKKDPKDKMKVAVIFSEKRNANLTFKNLMIDGDYMAAPRTWRKEGKNTILLTEEVKGIYIYNANSVTVENCRAYNLHGDGIAAFNTKIFHANNNIVENVSGSGIIGHKVDSMYVRNNKVKNGGVLTDEFHVDGKVTQAKSNPYLTKYGDGISAYSNYTIIANNVVDNGGRCGIVHDIAKELGYKHSAVIVENNTVTVNSNKIRNNNPPSGMWFEQTGEIEVKNNTVTFVNSNSTLVSGIRFYDVSSINMINNTLNAENYNKTSDNAIGIFESNLTSCIIEGNKISGKFKRGIAMSYEKSVSKVGELSIVGNEFKGNPDLEIGINVLVYGRNEFPKKMLVRQNRFDRSVKNPLDMSYFGTVSTKRTTSELIIYDSNVQLNKSLRGVRVVRK